MRRIDSFGEPSSRILRNRQLTKRRLGRIGLVGASSRTKCIRTHLSTMGVSLNVKNLNVVPASQPSLLSQVMDEVTCPICMCEFTDPVVLPACGHTFCRQCITKVNSCGMQYNHRVEKWVNVFRCPTCRAICNMGDLPQNWVFKQFCSAVEKVSTELDVREEELAAREKALKQHELKLQLKAKMDEVSEQPSRRWAKPPPEEEATKRSFCGKDKLPVAPDLTRNITKTLNDPLFLNSYNSKGAKGWRMLTTSMAVAEDNATDAASGQSTSQKDDFQMMLRVRQARKRKRNRRKKVAAEVAGSCSSQAPSQSLSDGESDEDTVEHVASSGSLSSSAWGQGSPRSGFAYISDAIGDRNFHEAMETARLNSLQYF